MAEGDMESTGVLWGKAFTWKIRGAGVDKVWAITGDFVGIDKWVTSLVQSCELVHGHPQRPGCVRRPVLFPASAGQPFTFGIEKLLLMDPSSHHYHYTIIGGTLPGFSLMQTYVSSFKLSSLHTTATAAAPDTCAAASEEDTTLLQWSFTCRPVSALSEEETYNIAFSLYKAAVDDLKKHLNLPNSSITLLD